MEIGFTGQELLTEPQHLRQLEMERPGSRGLVYVARVACYGLYPGVVKQNGTDLFSYVVQNRKYDGDFCHTGESAVLHAVRYGNDSERLMPDMVHLIEAPEGSVVETSRIDGYIKNGTAVRALRLPFEVVQECLAASRGDLSGRRPETTELAQRLFPGID